MERRPTNTLKKQSRIAALLYLISCSPAPLALLYVPNTLVVRGILLRSGFIPRFVGVTTIPSGKIAITVE